MYFSGGVDSGLLAARFAEMGRKDIQLINYGFKPHHQESRHQESQLALQMAAHLGLTCEQVMYDPSDIHQVLDRLGRDYSFPFGDESVIPTNLLGHASLGSLRQSLTAIDGTGADGAFGLGGVYDRWKRIYTIPSPVRRLAANGYKWLGLWQCASLVEGRGITVRRSVEMPLQHAAIVGKVPLDGIAYTIPSEIRQYLQETIRQRVQVLGRGLGRDVQMSLLDLVLVCAGRFAAKTYDPLRIQGMKVIFPFLEPPMLRLSSSIPRERSKEEPRKALLKRMLANSVPHEMVYRRKAHFIPPKKQMFEHVSMQEFLNDVVISPKNPLLDFCHLNAVKQMIKRSRHGQSLSGVAHNFLFVLMFTSGWLRQLDV